VQRSARRTFPDAAYAKAGAILDDDVDGAGLPDPIRRSVILWQGAFPPDFEHMSQFLS
jgi:hypothetical protein